MKIEPRKIKKTLKYAAVCTCVATAITFTGCNEVELSGDVPYTPSPSPEASKPYETEGAISTNDSTPEPTPEIAGGIPVMNTGEVELSGDVAYK